MPIVRLARFAVSRVLLALAPVLLGCLVLPLLIVALVVFLLIGPFDPRFPKNMLRLEDLIGNVILLGRPGEYISARLGFAVRYAGPGWQRVAKWICWWLTRIGWLCGSKIEDHCAWSASGGLEEGDDIMRWSVDPAPMLSYPELDASMALRVAKRVEALGRLGIAMDAVTLAKWVLYLEGRSGGLLLMTGQASVIMNRKADPGWWGDSIPTVCLAHEQFSCLDADNPEHKLLGVVPVKGTTDYAAYLTAGEVSEKLNAGTLVSTVGDCDSYYMLASPKPAWANGREPKKVIDDCAFFRVGVEGNLKLAA